MEHYHQKNCQAGSGTPVGHANCSCNSATFRGCKWDHPPHVLAATRQHVKDLLTALTSGGNVHKEFADLCVIAELIGVTPELIDSRRERFKSTVDLPALSDYEPPLKTDGTSLLPAVQLGRAFGYTQVELARMLGASVQTIDRQERRLKAE